jgi:hypothetical protein
MSGVFLSVPVALHFAYEMQARPASPESVLSQILRRNVRKGDVWRYGRPKVVFLDTLSQLEVHGQCAQIRAKVVRCLQGSECAVIRARYGSHIENEQDEQDVKRFAFSADLAQAIEYLDSWLASSFDWFKRLDPVAAKMLVAYAFTDSRRTKITLRRLAAEYGFSHVYYHHYYHLIDERLCAVELRALDLLTPLFAERGTCNGAAVVELAVHE